MHPNRVFLIPEGKKQYKANLHCHSTISDGRFSPEEIKALYKGAGYQVVALTDHEVMVPHEDLNDPDFLMLTSYEAAIYGDLDLPKPMRRLSHLNFYAKRPGTMKMPFFNTADVLKLDRPPDVSLAHFDGPEITKEYSAEGLNKLIRIAGEAGFLACLNHPTWSMEDASVYTQLQGLFAMEIFNTDCEVGGYAAYCPYIYDEMLRSGQRIAAVATDDTHKEEDLFGGFSMVFADRLEYEEITGAMERGDLYASRGPLIHALWFENGVFHIETSPVRRIVITNSGRRKDDLSVRTAAPGEYITSAEFALSDLDLYVRFTAEDEHGRTANTRGYRREEFTEEPAAVRDLLHRKIGGFEG
ncbi:MAG: hypothetical protein IJL73_02920 [Lachnospiraceae bacterium]|nr:hypothetical protein [Lachnospiraceae bacterium]